MNDELMGRIPPHDTEAEQAVLRFHACGQGRSFNCDRNIKTR